MKVFEHYIIDLKDKAFRFALSILKQSDQAQDVVQDLFEKLWKKHHELHAYQNIEAFSMKMVKNMCLDKLKHEQTKQSKLAMLEANPSHSENYTNKDTIEHVQNLIGALPPKQKMMMHLRDIEGLEFDEIAEIMDMEIDAVRMNVSRARKAVRVNLLKLMNYGV